MTNDTTTSVTKRTRVGHCKRDSTDVYAGRGPDGRDMHETPIGERGWLGNPYALDDGHNREESIETFENDFVDRILNDAEFADAVESLHGKTLGCWCQSLDADSPACHAEIIAQWADRMARQNHTDTNRGERA